MTKNSTPESDLWRAEHDFVPSKDDIDLSTKTKAKSDTDPLGQLFKELFGGTGTWL